MQIFKLVEKDFHSKLEILFKKNLYEVAQLLAQNQGAAAMEMDDYLMEIYTQWACAYSIDIITRSVFSFLFSPSVRERQLQ